MPAQGSMYFTGDAVATVKLDQVVKTNSATVGTDITMSANGVKDGVAKWVDRSDDIPIGYPWMTLSVREPTKVSRVYKVSCKLGVPRLATTSPSTNTGIEPAPTKAYELQAHLDFLLPERSTADERLKLLNMLMSALAYSIEASDGSPAANPTGSPLTAAVVDLDPVF